MAFGPKPPLNAALHSASASQNEFKPFLRLPITWIIVLNSVLLSWMFSSFNDLTPGYLAISAPVGLGKGPVAAGQTMMIYQLAFMAGSVASGFLVQKVFKGREMPVATMGFLMAAIFSFSIRIPAVYDNPTLLTVCLLIAGFFMGMPMPTGFGFISKHYPEEFTGKVGGMAMGIGLIGGTVGLIIGSVALGATGNYLMSILIVSVVGVVGAINGINLKTTNKLQALTTEASTQEA